MGKEISRRDFLTYSLAAGAGAVLFGVPGCRSGGAQALPVEKDTGGSVALAHDEKENAMPFTLPPLPYDKAALAPYLSAETLEYHYGKHHQAYVTNLNKLIEGKPEAKKSLEEIIMAAAPGGLFNNAAQDWNHTFYWSCMKPGGGDEPSGALRDAIERDFDSFAKFKEQLTAAATTLFGSGWTWLALDGGKLKIVQTKDADLPMKHGQVALLTIDVWEHAYYIDYRNLRPKYIEAFLDHLVNWDFAAANFARAK
jgi:Fe-Mn family superoxide dismutase